MRVVRVRRVALRRPGCGVVAKRMVCVPGRIRARMSDDNLACTPAQWERIISRYADPARSNSPAGRVAGLLRDDARASDLVREWVEDQAMRCMAKGQTVTPTLLTMICKRCSKEAILHRELGVSVKLLRAGAAYERRLAEYRNDHASGRPPRAVRERLWDEAVDAHIHGQMERGVSSMVFLPYHDGRNSRPGSSNLLACGGLPEWEALFGAKRRRFAPLEDVDEDHDPALMDHTGGEPFEVTAEWLERHGITPAMLNRLTDTELAVLGVDVRSARLESAGGVLDGVAGRLDLILDDPRASQALAAGRPMLGAVEILHSLGMDVGMIRAGMRLGRWSRAGDVHGPDMLRTAWDRIPGRGGTYDEYLRAVSDILDKAHALA